MKLSGAPRAEGFKSGEYAYVRYAADGTVTAEPTDVRSLEQELQRILEDAVIMAEALS